MHSAELCVLALLPFTCLTCRLALAQVGLVRTWSADRRLDAGLLQSRNSVDCALDVLHEHIPVQVKQAEGKLVRHLQNGNTNKRTPHLLQAETRQNED